jgi:hypothetical protein
MRGRHAQQAWARTQESRSSIACVWIVRCGGETIGAGAGAARRGAQGGLFGWAGSAARGQNPAAPAAAPWSPTSLRAREEQAKQALAHRRRRMRGGGGAADGWRAQSLWIGREGVRVAGAGARGRAGERASGRAGALAKLTFFVGLAGSAALLGSISHLLPFHHLSSLWYACAAAAVSCAIAALTGRPDGRIKRGQWRLSMHPEPPE